MPLTLTMHGVLPDATTNQLTLHPTQSYVDCKIFVHAAN